MINVRPVVPFAAGTIFGAVLISTAMAAGLAPYWNKQQVKPVVLVSYDSVYGFRLANDRYGTGPRWTKDEVTAIAATTYHQIYGFVPINTNQNIQIGPRWSNDEVVPWTQVVLDPAGDFVPSTSN
jgi:hypothetical protein